MKKGKQVLRRISTIDAYKKWLKIISKDDKDGEVYVYKYLTLKSFLLCLENANIRICQPSIWKDRYEGHFYNAKYNNVTNDMATHPLLYAYCVTNKPKSEVAWKQYAEEGEKGKCVQLKLYKSRLRDAFYTGFNKKSFIYFAKVDYSFSEYEIQAMHKKDSPFYGDLFKPFTLDKYIHLLLLKRDCFRSESEIRFLIIPPSNGAVKDFDFVNVDWKRIIKSIKFDPEFSPKEYSDLVQALQKHGFDESVINSLKEEDIYGDPNNCITIE